MLSLNFKAYKFNTKEAEGNTRIFDIVRKKYVLLTPEEWVRQNVIHYLVEDVGVPAGLISVEKAIVFNDLTRRFDICVAGRNGQLMLLVECKAPNVQLTQKTLMQISVYQKVLGVKFLFITNGVNHLFLLAEDSSIPPVQLPELPHYSLWT